jgi:hypothetical protein
MPGYNQDKLVRSSEMNHAHHRMSGRAVKDLHWWKKVLDTEQVGTTLQPSPSPDTTWEVFTDASDWGLAVVINDSWQRWRLKTDWRQEGRDIGWAEATAVEIAVRVLIYHFHIRNTHLLIRCDNIGVVDGWKKGASRNPAQNDTFIRIFENLLDNGCWLTLEYVPSKENPADSPSRGLNGYGMRGNDWRVASSWPLCWRNLFFVDAQV